MDYDELIESKKRIFTQKGFTPYEMPEFLFDFQKYTTKKAIERGKYAIFADCGMGKTPMQIEWGMQVSKHTGKKVLTLAPLSVKSQTKNEAKKFGYNLDGYMDVFNYEQLKNLDLSQYSGIILDESSILKNFEGKFRNLIIESFKDFDYKLCCTATPSPNDPMELGNHSEFLDIMKRTEMLATYFVHDGGDTSKWRLKGHAEKEFYSWVSTWATMISKPSDIGFNDNGFILPELNLHSEQIKTETKPGKLFNDAAVNATNFNQELRETFQDRINKTIEIVNNTEGQIIVWVKQNAEGDYLSKNLKDCRQVKGSDKDEYKEQTFFDFAQGEFKVLITKTKIAQFGLNFQNCPTQIFASLDFSFEGLYQAIRRSWRFGQKNNVNIYIITTDTMQNVYQSIKQKQKQFRIMQENMSTAISIALKDTKDFKYDFKKGDGWKVERGDCVKLSEKMESDSIDFTMFSPPFAELYVYSDHAEDMGNSKNYREFFKQFIYLIENLYRITKPGRLCAIHCMNLPIQKGKEGYIGLRDFPGLVVRNFERRGWIWHSEVQIWKDPVTEMTRTKALGLLHKQLKKDSSMSRMGIADKILVFRKPGENVNPIQNQDKDPSKSNYFPVDTWQKWASPVWFDINYSNTLQYRSARESKDEKHIAPLQLDTVERCIKLWSNEGDLVYDPFTGIGTTGYQALKMNRKFIGHELKQSYFNQACINIKSAIVENTQKTLF